MDEDNNFITEEYIADEIPETSDEAVAEEILYADFGNVTDEDYDNENDRDSMRVFYIIAITVLCLFIIATALVVTDRFFPNFITFGEHTTGQSHEGNVKPSVDSPDSDEAIADNGDGAKNDGGSFVADNISDTSDDVSQGVADDITDGSEKLTVTEIYKACVNSVVGITTEGTTTNIFGQVSKNASTGTGIVYSEDGYILTNYHVVESGSTHTVTLYNGTSYKAKLVGYEAANDVALLKIDANGLSAAKVGNSDSISVGEDVIVIGNPLGELTYTLTRGVVSALNRVINTDSNPKNMFQIDAAVNSGNSGGPAFDAYGRVIGIVTAKYSADTVEGIGFCIPVNDAVGIAEELKTYGYIRGKAGLEICAVDGRLTYGNGWFGSHSIYGAKVTYVKNGGAASKSGLSATDMIVEVNGKAVSSSAELQNALREFSIDDKIEIVAYHSEDGDTYDKKTYIITLGESSPLNVPVDYSSEKYGLIM